MTHELKIAICGAPKVGKTSAWWMWIYGKPLAKCPYDMHDDMMKNIEIDGVRFNCALYEIDRESEFQAMNQLYMRDADVVLIMYSILDPKSFEVVELIKNEIIQIKTEHPKPNSVAPVSFLIWENKTDVENARLISSDRGEELAAMLKLPFVRGSARDKEQTENIFNQLLRLHLEAKKNAQNGTNNNNNRKGHRECTVM